MLLYKNSIAELHLDESIPAFKFYHLSPCLSSEFRDLLSTAVELMKELKKSHPHLKLELVDARKIGAMDPELIEWLNSDFNPKIIELGYRRAAIIIPEDIFAKLFVQEYVEIQRDMETRYFENEDKAIAWLKEL